MYKTLLPGSFKAAVMSKFVRTFGMALVTQKHRYSIDRVCTMSLKRSCIYPKDVQRITGKSERSGRRLLQKIKGEMGKQEHQFVTIEEFATYTGINPDLVRQYIVD